MEAPRVFTKTELLEMNKTPTWNQCIIKIDNLADTQLAKLYPTGNAGLCGRIYIALPADLVLTYKIKEQYNIW